MDMDRERDIDQRPERARRVRPRVRALRQLLLSAAALLALLPALWLSATSASAAPPYASPSSADQLARDLSPASNPGSYASWWTAVARNGTYANWFWYDIMPNSSGNASRIDTVTTFWTQAVPGNWAPVPNIGGWPWASGGYYSQWLWLHAVPDNWAPVAGIQGWPWARGGYYTQWLWLHAIPDNWAMVGRVGGWPWASGGYYTQWLWLHAIPDNWARVANIGGWPWASGGYYTQWFWLHAAGDNWAPALGRTMGRLPAVAAHPGYVQDDQGYYRYWFWEAAVPDNWLTVSNIGGWPWASGGYYTQWFWLHAAPDKWAFGPTMAIDGSAGAGYFDYGFYHFATLHDFAWRDALSLGGSSGAGYFDYWYHGQMGKTIAHYQQLLDVAGGYLANASTFLPVSSWYDPSAQAVVAFTFDTEGLDVETCAVTDVLRRQGVPATFYLVGWTADELTPAWSKCLTGMEVQNHTANHYGSFLYTPETLVNTFPDAVQYDEIHGNVATVRSAIPSATMSGFRTPWCDGNKSFDKSVIRNALASGMTSDSSIATIPDQARLAGVVPPLGLAQFSLSRFPSPFVVGSANGARLAELPFTYPSDWTAGLVNGLDPYSAAPTPGAPGYAVTLWEKEFDEIYAQHGIMVVLMHPALQGGAGRYPDGLDQLITYMKSKPGVAFTTAAAADKNFQAATGPSK
jgi:peptidoglycan/xylan/chitin deacetylase (PgdA/CDA1 family)